MIERLPTLIPPAPGRPEFAGPDHPMRKVTRQVAFEPGGWTPERAAKVAALFDTLAADWHTRDVTERWEPLEDALERGGPFRGRALEVGSGTGLATGRLLAHFDSVVAVDLSMGMLRLAPPAPAPRVQADASRLPFEAGVADAVVLVNSLLFPAEVIRVLAPGGAVVWVNTLGDRTPIHLEAADVERALPGRWEGAAAEAGWGTWCVIRS